MGKGYKLRKVPQQRHLVRNLMLTIVQLLQQSRRPMSDKEIISALAVHFRRLDPEFQRQVRLNLLDAVSYGILKRQADVFQLRSKRLAAIMDSLAPRSFR